MDYNIPHEKFCVLPWVSLEATPIGSVRPCCLADDEIKDENGEKYNLLDIDITDVRNSQYMKDLRQQFLNEEQPDICRRCWSIEDSGGKSKRQYTLARLNNILGEQKDWTTDAKDLMFIDFKLGNVCNLKCRICGAWSSSTFAVEDLKQLPKDERKSSYYYQMIRLGEWPRKSKNFWEEIEKNVDSIRYLEFTGGEPFMIKEHFEFLQGLIDRGISNQVEIHYNTNGTQWPEKYIDIWTHFKHVEIAFSIDDIGTRFEYERTLAKWNEVESNISKFFDFRIKHSENITLQLCCTVNIFNVLHLDEVVNWFYFDKFDFVFWNLLHDGPQWCIKSLPENVKNVAKEKLRNTPTTPKVKKEWENIINFMEEKGNVPLEAIREEIDRLDNRREITLKDSHPELWNLLYE